MKGSEQASVRQARGVRLSRQAGLVWPMSLGIPRSRLSRWRSLAFLLLWTCCGLIWGGAAHG